MFVFKDGSYCVIFLNLILHSNGASRQAFCLLKAMIHFLMLVLKEMSKKN